MIVRLIITIILLVGFHLAHGQHSEKIQVDEDVMVEAINDSSFESLNSLGRSIGNKRLVFLGEADHGHGKTIETKAAVIRYLIEQLDFEVILFESNLYEKFQVNELLNNKSYPPFYVLRESFRNDDFYCESKEILFKTLIQSKHKVSIAGFDLSYTTHFIDLLERDLIKCRIKKRDAEKYLKLLKLINEAARNLEVSVPDEIMANFELLSNAIIDNVRSYPSGKCDLLLQVLTSNQGLSEWVKRRGSFDDKSLSNEQVIDNNVTREEYISRNLVWLITKLFPGKKIIISSSTFHISKEISLRRTMADFLPDSIKNVSYFLPFISYQGVKGYLTPDNMFKTQVFKRDSLSIEFKIHKAGISMGFLDTKSLSKEGKENLDKSEMYPSEIFPAFFAWSKIYDGIFFIDQMTPSRWKQFTLTEDETMDRELFKKLKIMKK